MAKLYFRYGAMGSSKTANAIMCNITIRSAARRRSCSSPSWTSATACA